MGSIASPESSRDLAYVTAPCTPMRCHSLERRYLYSVPTSPTKLSAFGASEPTTPSSGFGDGDEFRFETSCRFDSDFEVGRDFEYSGGPMAFADELFCDGKVMPQLKLPPRLQHGGAKESRDPSSHRGRKIRWNSWKEHDFDPFTVAMDRISKEKKTRRARSISPSPVNRPNGSLVYPSNSRSGPIILVNQSGPTDMEPDGDGYSKSIMLAEPKGLSFARSLRMVKMGHEGPMKGSSKRHKIKEFLFRTPTPTPTMKSEDKREDQWETKMATRFSFKFGRSIQVYEKKEKVSQVTNGALVQYRPRLFLCLGYGMKKSTF